MIRIFFLLLASLLLLPLASVAQAKPGYELYEKEDLDGFRKRFEFTPPTVQVATDTQVHITRSDDRLLATYFRQSNKTYIDADSRLGNLVAQQITANARIKTLPGYRIQLISSSERSVVAKVKSDFGMSFPDVPSYMPYISPTYRVRVGDFLTREEAIAACARIRAVYEGAFIVEEEVNIPHN